MSEESKVEKKVVAPKVEDTPVFVKLREMTQDQLSRLPKFNVVSKHSIIKDNNGRKTGERFTAITKIHDALSIRTSLSQAQFGLIGISQGKIAAREISQYAYIYFTKGNKKNGTGKYYFAEIYLNANVICQHFFSDDEVKLLNELVRNKLIQISFVERPESEEPTVASTDAASDDLL